MVDSLCKNITREYKAKLTKDQRKAFRSQMWAFRRDSESLSAEEKPALVALPRRSRKCSRQLGDSAAVGHRPARPVAIGLGLCRNDHARLAWHGTPCCFTTYRPPGRGRCIAADRAPPDLSSLKSTSLRNFAVAWKRASVRHTDAPSGLPRVLSCLGRLSCRNTGSQLNGRHPRPVNAYIVLAPGNDTS